MTALGYTNLLYNMNCEESIKTNGDGGHLEKTPPDELVARYLMNRRLDRTQIFCSSPGIYNDLINFWE